MLCTVRARAIDITSCYNVSISGLVVDYDPLTFTQGVFSKNWLAFHLRCYLFLFFGVNLLFYIYNLFVYLLFVYLFICLFVYLLFVICYLLFVICYLLFVIFICILILI
jgi:hypothetical protein